jgi:hypothetical protein
VKFSNIAWILRISCIMLVATTRAMVDCYARARESPCAMQITTLGNAPEARIIHIKKVLGQPQNVACLPRLRLNGSDYTRLSVVHHHGNTPLSGHYTATVDTEGAVYQCDDVNVNPLTLQLDSAWDNCYLAFFPTDLSQAGSLRWEQPTPSSRGTHYCWQRFTTRRKPDDQGTPPCE